VKFLFSPIGIALIVFVLLVVFLPRRAPDAVKRRGKAMRAFDDESSSAGDKKGDGGGAVKETGEDRSESTGRRD
jgi:Sec-independent protein translocase protein TatA